MQDVAIQAQVSVATVSHVINHTAKISEETVVRVQQVMEQLGYKQQPKADLHQGKRTIAVFVPDISNEFYASIAESISKEAAKKGYGVMICNIHHYQIEIGNIRSLIQTGVCGMIFCGCGPDDEIQIMNVTKRVPCVLCDRKIDGAQIDSVGTNNVAVLRQMITKLSRFGYTRIGFISEDLVMSNSYDRHVGFRLGMEECNLEIDPEWVILDSRLRVKKSDNAYVLMSELLAKKTSLPQVLLCTSDLIAIGVMKALQEHQIRIPQDIGVVGFDNISLAKFTTPPLTTIAQDMKQLGKVSVNTLIRKIEGIDSSQLTEDIALSAKIVCRKSIRL